MKESEVLALEVADRPGGLAELLEQAVLMLPGNPDADR